MVDSSVLQDDLRDMLVALGMDATDRPQSPHDVFKECIRKAARMRAALQKIADQDFDDDIKNDARVLAGFAWSVLAAVQQKATDTCK